MVVQIQKALHGMSVSEMDDVRIKIGQMIDTATSFT